MAISPFLYSESRVAERIGRSRKKFRELRAELTPEIDWKEIGGEIMLTAKAVVKIARLHSVKAPELEECLPGNGAGPTRKKMRVVPPASINPRVLLAQEVNEDGELVGLKQLVDVGRNETFCFDDEIEVERHPIQTGIWQCVSEIPRDRRRPRPIT